jgi:anti-sigma factor RsiW
MTCRQLIPDVIDFARGMALDRSQEAAVVEHLHSCASCAALTERERAMSAALRQVERDLRVSDQNELRLVRLMAAFDAPRRPASRVKLAVELSLAASVLIVAGLSVGWKSDAPKPAASERIAAPAVSRVYADSAFTVLPGADALPRFEHGEVIRVEIPSAGGVIEAEVLIGQDGLARAARLVQ